MGEISQWGYNPDKSRDGSGSGWDEKISSILTLHQDQGCCPRLFLMLLGQFPRISRESAWKNLGQSRLSPIFPDGLGFSISTQLRDQGGYPKPSRFLLRSGRATPIHLVHVCFRPLRPVLHWHDFGGMEHLDSSIVTLDAYHCDCTILVMS